MVDKIKLENKKLSRRVKSGLISQGKELKLEEEMIGDHMLQFFLEPILICESRFKFYTKRRNLSRMEILASIRSRIGFFAISNLFDKVEMKIGETDLVKKIQERHSFRLQQLEKTIERLHRKLEKAKKKKKKN